MKSCSLTSSIIPLSSFITLRQDMRGSTGQLSECTSKAGISWSYLRELIRAYIRICPVCQKMSYLKVPIIARRFITTAAGPMEVLNMDYEGPFPEDEYGNTYVLSIIDSVSRALLQTTNRSKPCSTSVLDSKYGMDPFVVCRALQH